MFFAKSRTLAAMIEGSLAGLRAMLRLSARLQISSRAILSDIPRQL